MSKKYQKPKPKPQAALSVKIERETTRTAPKPTTPASSAPPLLDQGGGEKDAAFSAGATLQQRRAVFALTRIRALAVEWQEEPKKQKEFNSYASAMPFMIHANGLGQTAAFYRRKGTDHTYYRLYQLLGDWLGQPGQPFAGQPDLLDGVTRSDLDAYLAAQAEALLFLDWVKKLASAFLAREEETAP